jgi:ATP-dependent DNA helicase DinG
MKCASCGFTIPFNRHPEGSRCDACGGDLAFDTEDFLLYGKNNLVTSVRPGQVEMARLCSRLIETGSHGLIEGPVGVGKSFAYLVPAILSGKRIVVSTAKKQLQHQIARKDAPHLAVHLDKPNLRAAVFKGKSNYACRLKADAVPDPEARFQFLEFLGKARMGDLLEAAEYFGGRPKYWFEVTAEDCVGSRCRWSEKCGYYRSRDEARTAQIIIANHHVVAFDLRFGPARVLPDYEVLVIDEAHQAPAAFRAAFSQTVSPWGAARVLKAMDGAGLSTGLEKALEATWTAMFEKIALLEGEVPADPFEEPGAKAIEILEAIEKEVSRMAKEIGGNEEREEEDDEEEKKPRDDENWEELAKLDILKRTVHRSLSALRAAQKPDENTVIFISAGEGPKKVKSVTIAPINVGPLVGRKLGVLPTVIATSATLSVNGSFETMQRQLGMDYRASGKKEGEAEAGRKVASLVVESPFDYRRQAVLYTPRHLPLPEPMGAPPEKRERYLEALAVEVARLLRASDGNAFVLFSATNDLEEVHRRLSEEELRGVELIPQGDDAEASLAQFLATPRSAILGLKSFWEGVDVVGDKLRLVVITKLPFPQMNDPVLLAKKRVAANQARARGQNEKEIVGLVFRTIDMPAMITDLRQGVGRLIRSTTDRGVCAILDPRVWTGSSKRRPNPEQLRYEGYGSLVVNSLGFSQRTGEFDAVARFLSQIRDTTRAA